MSIERRIFLQRTVAASAVGVALSAGLLIPRAVVAAWPKAAFKARDVNTVLSELMGGTDVADSADIKLKAPDIAENGAVVPLTTATTMAGVKHMLVLVEKNPAVLVAQFNPTDMVEANFAVRAKMGQSSDVYAVAIMNDGKAYFAK